MLVEPNPDLFKKIKAKRPNDVCLNVGIGPKDSEPIDYYVLTAKFLNTFKKEEADVYIQKGSQKIERVLKIPLMSIHSIMDKHFPNGLDVLSLDAEGLDTEILRSMDFTKYRPKIICVETLLLEAGTYKEIKVKAIPEHLVRNGYEVFADSHVNTIFVDAALNIDQRAVSKK